MTYPLTSFQKTAQFEKDQCWSLDVFWREKKPTVIKCFSKIFNQNETYRVSLSCVYLLSKPRCAIQSHLHWQIGKVHIPEIHCMLEKFNEVWRQSSWEEQTSSLSIWRSHVLLSFLQRTMCFESESLIITLSEIYISIIVVLLKHTKLHRRNYHASAWCPIWPEYHLG